MMILATATANALARSLVAPAGDLGDCSADSPAPALSDLFSASDALAPSPTRWPLRG